MTLAISAIAFVLLEGNTWGWVFFLGVIATIVNYVVGDLTALPKYGKLPAAAGEHFYHQHLIVSDKVTPGE